MTTPYLTPPVFSWPAAPGGKLHTYLAGGTTPQATYSDAAGVTPNTNPVTLDSLGSAVVRLAVGVAYHFVLKDSLDVTTLWDADNYDNAYLTSGTITAAIVGAVLYPQTAAEIAAGVTPVNFAYVSGMDLRYGVVRDDATDNQTALTNLIAVGNQGVPVTLTAGVARHSGTLNWSFNNLKVYTQGKSQLRHTGTGVANLIDGVAGSITNVLVDGVEELGNLNTTYGWDIRALVRSVLNVRSKNCTTSGMRIRFAVLCDIRFITTNNDVAYVTQPVNGLILDQRNAGEYVSFCTIESITEGVSGTGLVLTSTFGNTLNGTSEGNGSGVSIAALCHQDTFRNFDCESNTSAAAGSDWSIQGTLETFINTNSTSSAATNSTDVSNSSSLTFIGGYHRSVNLQVTALDTTFVGFGTSDNGALGIHGTGTYRQVGTIRYNTSLVATQRPNDRLGAVSSFTATLTGCTTSPTGSVTYSVNGDSVTLDVPLITGTSNTTAATLTGVPTALTPTTAQKPIGLTIDSGTSSISTIQVNTDGTITLFKGVSATFTNTGTKGTDSCTITYRLSA